MQKTRDFKVIFWKFPNDPLGALRLPRMARNRGSTRLPYLEIKLTFECTARFYGLSPPLLNHSVLWRRGRGSYEKVGQWTSAEGGGETWEMGLLLPRYEGPFHSENFGKYMCKSVQYGAFSGKIRILNNWTVFNLHFGLWHKSSSKVGRKIDAFPSHF